MPKNPTVGMFVGDDEIERRRRAASDTNEQRDPVKEAREFISLIGNCGLYPDAAQRHIKTLCDEVDRLRTQNQTQAKSITYFQENEKSLKAQLAQSVTLTKREARILTDYHYYEAEKAITRLGCKPAQQAHLERLSELRKIYEPTD